MFCAIRKALLPWASLSLTPRTAAIFTPACGLQCPRASQRSFRAWLTPLLQRNGMLESHQVIARDTSFFSVVTTASQDLLPIQCIPHYDSTDPKLFAAVIYLCGPTILRHRVLQASADGI